MSAPPTPVPALPTTAPSHRTEVLSNTPDQPQNQELHATIATHHCALDILEVVENILVHLPMKDLFIHQRVSRQFQAATKSPGCQKKMFLAPSNTPRESWKLVQSEKKRGRGSTRWSVECVDPGSDDDPETTTPVTLNPILKVAWPGRHANASCAERKRSRSQETERVRSRAREQAAGRHSSLFATYISDPPCKLLTISTVVLPRVRDSSSKLFWGDVKLRSETGLKLGDLWNGLLNPRGSAAYRWKNNSGVNQQDVVVELRTCLDHVGIPSVISQTTWNIGLIDAVVPTAEEWAAVRQRDAQR
jgi:hypothetical protein